MSSQKKSPDELLVSAAKVAHFKAADGWPAEFSPSQIAVLHGCQKSLVDLAIAKGWLLPQVVNGRRLIAKFAADLPSHKRFRKNISGDQEVYYETVPQISHRIGRQACAAWLESRQIEPGALIAEWLRVGGIEQPTDPDREQAEDPTVDTTGLVAWQAATLENWRQITEKYGSTPTAREVMRWLGSNGPRDVFPEQQNERNRLLWIDTYGMRQTVSYSRVASVLSAWRKSGKIAAR